MILPLDNCNSGRATYTSHKTAYYHHTSSSAYDTLHKRELALFSVDFGLTVEALWAWKKKKGKSSGFTWLSPRLVFVLGW